MAKKWTVTVTITEAQWKALKYARALAWGEEAYSQREYRSLAALLRKLAPPR